jgi:hypothetical protein
MSPTIGRQANFAALALAAGIIAFAAGSASAQNPHFVRAAINLDNDGNLVCSWKEAGLGQNVNIDYTCGADVVFAFYQCVNRGGGEPRPHTATQTDPEATGTFSSGQNGQITGSLTVDVPSAAADFCPNQRNWTLRLVGVRWCNAFLSDDTNDIEGAFVEELTHGSVSQLPLCPVT